MKKLSFVRMACMAVALSVATITSQAQTFNNILSFDVSNGDNPWGALIQGTDGNFYGTTSSEYGSGYGSVFSLTSGGALTTVYSFCALPSCADGSYPIDGVIQASDGNFYGVTNAGGAKNDGTIFRLTPGGVLTTLYSFCAKTNCTDGIYPSTGLVQASNGNFYGTTSYGGVMGFGTVYEITPAGQLTTIYSFCSATNCVDGQIPFGQLIQAKDGNLYGTTYSGGTSLNYGTIYSISLTGKLTTIYSFCSLPNCVDGDSPYAGVVQSGSGGFFGTASLGGANGWGTVYKITPAGRFTVLHAFCAKTNCPDGKLPTSRLVQGSSGDFYGTTAFGGSGCPGSNGYSGCGTVYKITPAGRLTRLHAFDSADGANPQSALLDVGGTFYGSTLEGGSSAACSSGCGTLFSLSGADK